MPDEENYETHFLEPNQALLLLNPASTYAHIVKTAYELWVATVQLQEQPDYVRYIAEVERQEKLLTTGRLEGVEEVDEAEDEHGEWEDTDSSATDGSSARSPTVT